MIHVAPSRTRPRIRPTWRAGLRHGRVRDTMTAYLEAHPEYAEDLRRILREIEARGYEPASMAGVRQPFDFEPRR